MARPFKERYVCQGKRPKFKEKCNVRGGKPIPCSAIFFYPEYFFFILYVRVFNTHLFCVPPPRKISLEIKSKNVKIYQFPKIPPALRNTITP